MQTNALPSEQYGVVATVDPDAYSASTQTSDWVDMADYDAIMAIVMSGDLGSDATLDAKLEQATDSSGSGAKDISGKSITQLIDGSPSGGGEGSDKQAIINCRGDELDIANSFRYVRLSMTIGTASSDAAGIVLGRPVHQPATDNDLSSVDEVVT